MSFTDHATDHNSIRYSHILHHQVQIGNRTEQDEDGSVEKAGPSARFSSSSTDDRVVITCRVAIPPKHELLSSHSFAADVCPQLSPNDRSSLIVFSSVFAIPVESPRHPA